MHLAYVDGRIENYRSEFILELKAQFGRISVIANFHGEEIDKSVNVPLYEKSLLIFSRKIVYFSSVYCSLLRVKPDLILTGDLGLRTLLCLAYAKKYSVPIYVWARLTTWSERSIRLPRKLLRKLILSQISGVFVNGEDGSKYINSVFPCKTHILYQSSSHSRLKENRAITCERQITRWTFVGRIVEQKGLKQFLVALADIDTDFRTKLHLDFVGVGALSDGLENYSQQNNIKVQFHGILDGKSIIELLDMSDFFIFPSLGDEWGLAVVEAMNRGVPILGSSKAGVINELSSFGDFGIIFDPFSHTQIKDAINEALSIGIEKLQYYSDESLRLAKHFELQPRKMAQKMYGILVSHQI